MGGSTDHKRPLGAMDRVHVGRDWGTATVDTSSVDTENVDAVNVGCSLDRPVTTPKLCDTTTEGEREGWSPRV